MNKLLLRFNDGFIWHHSQHISFKGYFFDQKGNFCKGQQAIKHFGEIADARLLGEALSKLDGCFTVIIQKGEKLLIGVDTIEFFPLFFRYSENHWQVSDNWYSLTEIEPVHINQEAFHEFESGGYVLGGQTLSHDINKTESASVLTLQQDGQVRKNKYFDFLPEKFSDESYGQQKQNLIQVFEKVTRRLIISLENRTAVVPLSGGYDSRIIACMLKRAGYSKVICITYGRPGFETEISEKVAASLGFPWHMVDYSKINPGDFLKEGDFLAYYRYAANGYTMPYLQEYFATRQLKQEKKIPPDAVFIPGHTGDWLAGSYIEKIAETKVRNENLHKYIIETYFNFIPLKKRQKKIIGSRLKNTLGTFSNTGYITHPRYNVHIENWDIREKRPKFIFHSSQVFPFFGYEIRFPLWDKEFCEYFREIPFEYRAGKKLFNEVLVEHYFKPLEVHFPEEYFPPVMLHPWVRSVKSKLRRFIPMRFIMKRMRANDHICYEKFTDELDNDLKKQGHLPLKRFYSFNARICRWYLHTISKG